MTLKYIKNHDDCFGTILSPSVIYCHPPPPRHKQINLLYRLFLTHTYFLSVLFPPSHQLALVRLPLLTYLSPHCYPSPFLQLICSSHPYPNLTPLPHHSRSLSFQLLWLQLTTLLNFNLPPHPFYVLAVVYCCGCWLSILLSEKLYIYHYHRLRVSGSALETVSRCGLHTDICCPHHRPGPVLWRSTGTCMRVTGCGRSNRHPSHPPCHLNIHVTWASIL